jgi:AraC-like DNA-binding protein
MAANPSAIVKRLPSWSRTSSCHAGQSSAPPTRGIFAVWQQRVVAAYIEEHLAEAIPLHVLAKLVHLSAYYFCRAFKQSFGIPPDRYHINRRIDRAPRRCWQIRGRP